MRKWVELNLWMRERERTDRRLACHKQNGMYIDSYRPSPVSIFPLSDVSMVRSSAGYLVTNVSWAEIGFFSQWAKKGRRWHLKSSTQAKRHSPKRKWWTKIDAQAPPLSQLRVLNRKDGPGRWHERTGASWCRRVQWSGLFPVHTHQKRRNHITNEVSTSWLGPVIAWHR